MNNNSLIIQCQECGTRNRIPDHKLNDKPKCGKCKTPISMVNVFDKPVDINDQTFNSEVISHKGVVLVDCWAPWCGPCKMVAPILDELAREYAGKVKITKLNVDENQITSQQHSVQSIPTMLIFKEGRKFDTLVGSQPKGTIEKHLNALL